MSKLIKKASLLLSSCILIVSYQNCGNKSLEATNSPSKDSLPAQADSCLYGTDPLSGNCITRLCTPNKEYGPISCTSQVAFAGAAFRSLTCDPNGTNYVFGTCTIQTCISGYTLQQNTCILDPLAPPM